MQWIRYSRSGKWPTERGTELPLIDKWRGNSLLFASYMDDIKTEVVVSRLRSQQSQGVGINREIYVRVGLSDDGETFSY